MNSDNNNQADDAQSQNSAGDESQVETVSVSKAEYDKLNQTLGSLKRELKDVKKSKDEPITETPKSNSKPDESNLLQKAYLRSAGITSQDEVELALSTAKKWDVSVDSLVDDEDFKAKLEKLRTQKSNEVATSGIKGGAGKSQAKDSPEYWIAKGVPPSSTDVPDRKTRVKIARAMMADAKNSKTFYND